MKRMKYRYEHPDIIRHYLQKSPCAGCEFEILCDTPCDAYLRWYDARMVVLRYKLNADCNTKCIEIAHQDSSQNPAQDVTRSVTQNVAQNVPQKG